MSIDILLRSIVTALVAMIVLGLATLLSVPIQGYSPGSISELWQNGVLMHTYMMLYGITTFIILVYMWGHRGKKEYIIIPLLSTIGLVIMARSDWPVGLVLPLLFSYLTVAIYWAGYEHERPTELV